MELKDFISKLDNCSSITLSIAELKELMELKKEKTNEKSSKKEDSLTFAQLEDLYGDYHHEFKQILSEDEQFLEDYIDDHKEEIKEELKDEIIDDFVDNDLNQDDEVIKKLIEDEKVQSIIFNSRQLIEGFVEHYYSSTKNETILNDFLESDMLSLFSSEQSEQIRTLFKETIDRLKQKKA